MRTIFTLLCLLASVPLTALADEVDPADSLRTSDIREVIVVSAPKETLPLRQLALSSTTLDEDELEERVVSGLKDLSAQVPNLFIPSYGSRLTTSMYIRGIGSRIGTPVVALYVDGVPQSSAASYDFDLSGVQRIDVLRGPQATLYGRNSMGGVIRVYTRNPFDEQGTEARTRVTLIPETFGTRQGAGGHYRFDVSHSCLLGAKAALSLGAHLERDGGYFQNEARCGENIDYLTDAGARARLVLRPHEALEADLTASFEWLRQGGYPYRYEGVVGTPSTPEPETQPGQIAYNYPSGYRRVLTNVGGTVERRWEMVTLTSITGYQHLADQMDLDQDFTTTNLYTLMQKQRSHTLSEELVLKRRLPVDLGGEQGYSWLFGLTAFHQWLRTEGPVTFYDDGLRWLNGLINSQANTHLPTITSHDADGREQYRMNFVFNNLVEGNELGFPGTYKSPSFNAALFHQSTFDHLFGVRDLTLTAGLRLDVERMGLNYCASYAFDQTYGLGGRLTYPDGSVRDGMSLVPAQTYGVSDQLDGKLHSSYLQLLPKLSLKYKQLYASVSRGYRSGGYNVQMFSDLLQGRMQTAIMRNVANATVPVVDAVPMIPADVKQSVRTMLIDMGTQGETDVQGATWYKPESSWNYEVGAHLVLFDRCLRADVAAFWMDTRDQQVSKMTSGGLGRVTVNSGRSRSIGAEVAVQASLTDGLLADVAYGYTHAKFRGDGRDTFVPFVPRHTLSVGLTQTWQLSDKPNAFRDLSLHVDYRGAGRIYWTEVNTASQAFAGVLNLRVSTHYKNFEVAVYATNLLSTRFQTFYFETMQRAFAQYSRPIELGAVVRSRF